jgi:hypothetical protein
MSTEVEETLDFDEEEENRFLQSMRKVLLASILKAR